VTLPPSGTGVRLAVILNVIPASAFAGETRRLAEVGVSPFSAAIAEPATSWLAGSSAVICGASSLANRFPS